MRTLKLTHEEIELIQRALGIAEMKFSNIRKEYISETVTVRGVDSISIVAKEVDNILNLEHKFANLNVAIKNSEKDV